MSRYILASCSFLLINTQDWLLMSERLSQGVTIMPCFLFLNDATRTPFPFIIDDYLSFLPIEFWSFGNSPQLLQSSRLKEGK